MELAIMHVLWERGPSTVQEVQESLGREHAYTTVQTILNTMERKGRTKRRLKGKAYVYRSSLSKKVALGQAVRDLIDRTFRGSVEGLLMNLIDNEQISEETLDRIKEKISSRGEL